jgi:hypothetical protein
MATGAGEEEDERQIWRDCEHEWKEWARVNLPLAIDDVVEFVEQSTGFRRGRELPEDAGEFVCRGFVRGMQAAIDSQRKMATGGLAQMTTGVVTKLVATNPEVLAKPMGFIKSAVAEYENAMERSKRNHHGGVMWGKAKAHFMRPEENARRLSWSAASPR